jgi:hypothetical protein
VLIDCAPDYEINAVSHALGLVGSSPLTVSVHDSAAS